MEKTRVLVVDDELDTLNLLKMLLEVTGFDPIATLNSVEAIALAELEKPDVILLDIMMPKLDGFALCKMMRQHPSLKVLPIIFVTAYESLDLDQRQSEAGADAVVNKPINMDMLTTTIKEVQDARKLAKQNGQSTSTTPVAPAIPTVEAPKAKTQPAAVVKTTEPSIVVKPEQSQSTSHASVKPEVAATPEVKPKPPASPQ